VVGDRRGRLRRQQRQQIRQRLADRRRALEIARRNPGLANEIGIGRPDKAGAPDAGLVDVNNASVTALLGLPGIVGGVVEGLRGKLVFLPRS
jgi:hypothetical protein